MDSLRRLIEALHADGVYSDAHPAQAWELADALWLASHIAEGAQRSVETSGDLGSTGTPDQIDSDPRTTSKQRPASLDGTPTTAPREPRAPLHVREPEQPVPGKPGRRSRTFPTPQPRLLEDPLAIGRALRPLIQRVPSRIRRTLDEPATVHNLAELRVPIPVLRGAPERLLELALVVDSHDSLILWEPLLRELIALFARHGAFRDLRVWRIGTDTDGRTRLWPGLHGGSPQSTRVLLDPQGRRAVLVFSDFSADAWRAGWRGGLLSRAPQQLQAPPLPLETIYDFKPGVRQLLIDDLPLPMQLQVHEQVSRAVTDELGAPHDFLARFTDPTEPLDPNAGTLEPRFRPFAHIRLQLLRRLGGGFGSEAARLAHWLSRDEAGIRADSPSEAESNRRVIPTDPTPFRDRFEDGTGDGPDRRRPRDDLAPRRHLPHGQSGGCRLR